MTKIIETSQAVKAKPTVDEIENSTKYWTCKYHDTLGDHHCVLKDRKCGKSSCVWECHIYQWEE